MPQPHLGARFRRAGVITHQNNLNVRMQIPPAPDRIPLDDVDVPDKRLRRGKKRQHSFNKTEYRRAQSADKAVRPNDH